MYSNNILNVQESAIHLNGCTRKSGNLLNLPRIYIEINEYVIYFKFGIEVLFQFIYLNLYFSATRVLDISVFVKPLVLPAEAAEDTDCTFA